MTQCIKTQCTKVKYDVPTILSYFVGPKNSLPKSRKQQTKNKDLTFPKINFME